MRCRYGWMLRCCTAFTSQCWIVRASVLILLCASTLGAAVASAAPKVIVISLDGATPRLVKQYMASGALSPTQGLGLLQSKGVHAEQNTTIWPSLTAPGHIAIATGSSAAHNDIIANTFQLVASPFNTTISGFAAPIGGYELTSQGPVESATPTAEPLWLALRAAGKTVVAATFPGADGLAITVPGLTPSPIVQPASERTVDYTVPFGAFAGVAAQGFSLTQADFGPAPETTTAQLAAAGKVSFSPVLQKTAELETFTVGGVTYHIQVAAFDTTDDGEVNYDTLVFFNAAEGIQPGPFHLPSTGPAYVSSGQSNLFYLEGSSNTAGLAFYVTRLAPDLTVVRLAQSSANAIPRPPNPAVLADVDDINTHVGFWAPQADFRIPERLSLGFTTFPDTELEAIYEEQVHTFVDYQTRLALRAIERNPDADLVMVYIEEPDGSSHQFLLTDPRQPTDFTNPASIGPGQDPAKIARYRSYVTTAYQVADGAVQQIIDAVGVDSAGKPNSNIIVVSDHGFDSFYTAVNMTAFLASQGFDPTKVRAVTSGPAVNLYINLQGREPDGTVSQTEYRALQYTLVSALKAFVDTNPIYTLGAAQAPVFDKVFSRPLPDAPDDPPFGLGTSKFIGQDSGDVFAILTVGYNFDGTQTPPVLRLGDPATETPILSVPNFYGAHGYDPRPRNMSAIFVAAGPDIRSGLLPSVRNIDVAPTVAQILGVQLSSLVQGRVLCAALVACAGESASGEKLSLDSGVLHTP